MGREPKKGAQEATRGVLDYCSANIHSHLLLSCGWGVLHCPLTLSLAMQIFSANGNVHGQGETKGLQCAYVVLLLDPNNLPQQEQTLCSPFSINPRTSAGEADINPIHRLEQDHPAQPILDQLQ